jgi:outer membrane protein OmpA-like peptidoglycan-associated protein
MRTALIAVIAFGVSGCALTRSSGPYPSQPMCMPCTDPCYPSDDCVDRGAKKVVAAAPAPAPAPAPVAAPQPAEAPTFSPSPGSYTGMQVVALSSATPGATIHYTTDGSEPTASSTVYTGPIPVSGDTTICALAVAPGVPASSLTAGSFDVSQSQPPPPPARVVMTAEKIELKESVYFDTSKTTIKAVSLPLLDEVAQLLTNHPEVEHVTVEGHTDSAGGTALNQKLSEGRAQAVRTYLVEKGVAASRLEAKGFGESRPIADNATAKGRETNRRVEFKITN